MTGSAVDAFGSASALQGVPSALAAARDSVDALLGDRGRRRTTPEDTAEALLRGAASSARLAGSDSTLEDAHRGSGDALTGAAVRLNAGLLALVPVVNRSPLQALARMHALAAAGMVPEAELGRPRPDREAADVLRALAARLVAPTVAPAIAVASLAHAEIVTRAPFAVGNDLVGRALERLLLTSRGVDPASVTVPESGHLLMGAEYEQALAGFASGHDQGVRRWLLYACAAIAQGLNESPLRGPHGDSDGAPAVRT